MCSSRNTSLLIFSISFLSRGTRMSLTMNPRRSFRWNKQLSFNFNETSNQLTLNIKIRRSRTSSSCVVGRNWNHRIRLRTRTCKLTTESSSLSVPELVGAILFFNVAVNSFSALILLSSAESTKKESLSKSLLDEPLTYLTAAAVRRQLEMFSSFSLNSSLRFERFSWDLKFDLKFVDLNIWIS